MPCRLTSAQPGAPDMRVPVVGDEMVVAGSDPIVAHTNDEDDRQRVKDGWRLSPNAVATVVDVETGENVLLKLRTSDGVVSCWLLRTKFKFASDRKQQPLREPRSGGRRAQRKEREQAAAKAQLTPTHLQEQAAVSPVELSSPEITPEQTERPTEADISSCISVLRRLRPSDLEDPEFSELLEVAGSLFKRKFFKDKFGSDDAVDFLKNRTNVNKKISKLQTLEKIVHGSRETTRRYVETKGINLARKAKFEQIKAEMALMNADDPENLPIGDVFKALVDSDTRCDSIKDIATSETIEDVYGVGDMIDQKLGPKGDYHRTCNGCGGSYKELHHFYHHLCPECASLSWEKRHQTADMTGMVCVVTGGRVRIGYQIVLKLLRQGAFVLTTTRFPMDCAQRFSREDDFDVWRDRLEVVGPLELSNMRLVERFCDQLIARFPRIHVLINNAAQTLTRSEGWFYRMLQLEDHAGASLSEEARALLKTPADMDRFVLQDAADVVDGAAVASSTSEPAADPAPLSPEGHGSGTAPTVSQQVACSSTKPGNAERIEPMWSEAINLADFPKGQLDDSRQPLDLTAMNSWDRRLCNVSTLELLQTLAANTAAPFIMCSRLASVIGTDNKADPYGHIVNVAALEGKFSVKKKSKCHPHTNMAKAALNMLTHTTANDLFARRILMNSADTGWVTDMASRGVGPIAATHVTWVAPPLDEEDGAARVLDPVFSHLKDPAWLVRGKYFKDFFVANW